MEYLQYLLPFSDQHAHKFSFKPYYKWNTFNTEKIYSKLFKKCMYMF